jgi:hypothetical protein
MIGVEQPQLIASQWAMKKRGLVLRQVSGDGVGESTHVAFVMMSTCLAPEPRTSVK